MGKSLWVVKQDTSARAWYIDGPGVDGLKYYDRRGEAVGVRDALEAAYALGKTSAENKPAETR